jgi:chemotaxis protein CheC
MMLELTELQQDALGEIFNIGVGAAADVLSQMVNETVRLSVPDVLLTSQQIASERFKNRESRSLCAIRQTYSGEVTTDAILMFPEENSLELVRSMVGSEIPLDQLTEMEQDAMAEIGNIILNAIISKLADTLEISFEGSLPNVSIVSGDGIFAAPESVNILLAEESAVLSLTIDFELATRQVNGYLAFLLDIPSSKKLIEKLIVYVGEDL